MIIESAIANTLGHLMGKRAKRQERGSYKVDAGLDASPCHTRHNMEGGIINEINGEESAESNCRSYDAPMSNEVSEPRTDFLAIHEEQHYLRTAGEKAQSKSDLLTEACVKFPDHRQRQHEHHHICHKIRKGGPDISSHDVAAVPSRYQEAHQAPGQPVENHYDRNEICRIATWLLREYP